MQTALNFSQPLVVHTKERTAETEAHVKRYSKKFSSNCEKLIRFWQSKWYWLSDDDSRAMVGVRNIAQRVADLRHKNGIAVESHYHEGEQFKRYRLQCTCHLIGGVKESQGCYVHSEELKLK